MLTVQEVTHIKIKDTICYNEMRLLRQFDVSWMWHFSNHMNQYEKIERN